MVQYTNPELTDMVLIYGEALSNAGAARRLYMERFPGRSRSRRVLDLEPEILQAVEEEPNVSCRRLALRMGVSSFTIWRTLHEQGLHPYHL
ncbi:unnamed protein product, partial [Tenebrio molitor]